MPTPKLKAERYSNFGGINTKVSPYQNSALEFLDIKNFDFQTPGALSQRWGSTQYTTQNFGAPITSLYEFERLNGASYVIVGHTGGVWFGATTGQSQGMSFTSFLATLSLQAIPTPYVYPVLTDPTLVNSVAFLGLYGAQNVLIGTTFSVNYPAWINGGNRLDLETFVDWSFMADGDKAFKFNGVTTRPIGLIPPIAAGYGVTVNNAATAFTAGIGASPAGFYFFYASYVNDRGFESQIWPIAIYANVTGGSTSGVVPSMTTLGGSFIQYWVDMYTPSAFGISAINVYSYYGTSFPIGSEIWDKPYVLTATYPASGGETTRIALGGHGASARRRIIENSGLLPDPIVNEFQLGLGATIVSETDPNIGIATPVLKEVNFLPSPRYADVFQESMVYSGFSLFPSVAMISGPGEPEGIFPDSNFEVRTNDGDYITAQKAFNGKIYFFKRKSFHALLGDNVNNYVLTEISLEYGALNNNCVVVYDDVMLFLDQKGLMIYNGASLECISNKVQPFFERMNYSVALETATIEHDKLRNQIVIGIPLDNSTTNNITLVYDYLTKAWTTYTGFTPTVFRQIRGRNNSKNLFYGSHSGTVNWFGPSFLSDNGVGFTTSFKTSNFHDSESIEKMFRRLYLNVNAGSTFVIPINFYKDYGASIYYSTTMVLSQFQSRIDFGIPAKALAFEVFCNQTVQPLNVYGFTVEARVQRRV